MEGTTVWEATNKKGKDYVSVKKSKPVTFEGVLKGPTRYFMRVWTDEKLQASIRSIDVDLEVKEESGKTLRVKKNISFKAEKFEYRFSVANSATWKLVLSSPALVKAVKGFGVIYKVADFEPEAEYSAENISQIEREIFSADQLDESEKRKLEAASAGWPNPQQTPVLNFPMAKAIEQLARDSSYKKRAFDKGLIRPFLFFVSMHPETRLRWAQSLGINLLNSRCFGDPHREADKILTADFKGIQSRASHAFSESARPFVPNANWYQILQRVTRFSVGSTETEKDEKKKKKEEVKGTRKTFKQSINDCKNPSSFGMIELENYFSDMYLEVVDSYRATNKPDLHQHLQDVGDSEQVLPLIQKLREARFVNDKSMKIMAAAALTGMTNSSLDHVSETKEKVDSKQDTKEKISGAKAALPAIAITAQVVLAVTPFFALSPMILIPVTMLTLNSAGHVLRETPGRLLMPLIAILNQRELLAFNGVRIEDYYGYSLKGEALGSSPSSSGASPSPSPSSSSSSSVRRDSLSSSGAFEEDQEGLVTPVDRLMRKLREQFPQHDTFVDRFSLFCQWQEIEELYDILQIQEPEWTRLALPADLKSAALSISQNPSSLFQ
eukprot:TRINITY_DN1722_c0_g1_i1.p1 TRINITY_DN1722_c0_g1~~TRINITY_DN1722_c0_g1_i1.p1  ORF type:complete len:610 (+),score=276.65 TRINITY_DN1722_c0_g1_i1:702-2531(+)